MRTRRIIGMATMALAMALLFAPKGVLAQTASKGEAPKLFADLSSSTRVYPNADAGLTGFALGSLYKPSEKCVHLAGEFFARFGRKDGTPEDLKMRTAGGAHRCPLGDWRLGPLVGAGAMVDLGWGRVGARNGFVSSAYLRALLVLATARGVLVGPRRTRGVRHCARHRRRRRDQGPGAWSWDRRVLG